jgi:ElaB/YqjD/DUF883 family membrane-anchored ribosome-binding protein
MPTPIEFESSDTNPAEDPRQPLLDQLESLGNHVTHFVTTRPLAAVGIVLAVGFLLGRMARR